MAKWDDYKAQAQERGSLALELYVVESTPLVDPASMQASLAAHLAYQKQQEKEGKLAFAGPLSDDTGDLMEGSGLIVYRARSLAEARDIADVDPMHADGKRSYRLRRWLINEGSFSLVVGLSDQSAKFV